MENVFKLTEVQEPTQPTQYSNPIDNHWNRIMNQQFYQGSSTTKPSTSTVNSCPIDHTKDSDVIANYYKIVKKCNLEEIGLGLGFSTGVGEGRNAAVLSYHNTHIGPIFINSNKQAEAICDVVTCLDRDCAVGEVSQRLLGSEIVQYLRDSIPR